VENQPKDKTQKKKFVEGEVFLLTKHTKFSNQKAQSNHFTPFPPAINTNNKNKSFLGFSCWVS